MKILTNPERFIGDWKRLGYNDDVMDIFINVAARFFTIMWTSDDHPKGKSKFYMKRIAKLPRSSKSRYDITLRQRHLRTDLFGFLDILISKMSRAFWIEMIFKYGDRFREGNLPGVDYRESTQRWRARCKGVYVGDYDTSEAAYMAILKYKQDNKLER